MGTQGPGRKRVPNRDRVTAEDDALDLIAREAEARLAAKRAARAEARDIRMKELEKQQKEVSDDEERMSVGSRSSLRVEEKVPDRDFQDKTSRTASTLSAATLASLASLGGASSRRGSCDTSLSVDTETSIRDIRECVLEAEEKYRKAMISNAQLHNDKCTLMYQVEVLREELSDLEEVLWEARRHQQDTCKELQSERQSHTLLQFHFKLIQQSVMKTELLLTKHRVEQLPADVTANGDTTDDVTARHDTRFAEESPSDGAESSLEVRVERVLRAHVSLQQQVALLQCQLAECHSQTEPDGLQRPDGGAVENGMDEQLLELQRDASRQISELKFKLVKSEQEVTSLEQNVIRLEGQVSRHKMAAENSEKMEEQLKVEKRRLHRELRAALDRADELAVANGHLTKRLEKMKANRSALLAQQ